MNRLFIVCKQASYSMPFSMYDDWNAISRCIFRTNGLTRKEKYDRFIVCT